MTLSVSNVSRSFGGVKAAQDVSLEVPAGPIVGLIGPNGAGKSTLVNLITGVLRLDGGSVRVDEEDVSRLTIVGVSRAGVARTFQNIRLLPDSTVLQNVVIGMCRYGESSPLACMFGAPSARQEMRTLEQGAMEILCELGLEAYAHHAASGLAYGHQRRVEIARAIATRPKYILLDEPAAGMNDVESEELGQLFKGLAGRGIGLLLIEHNMNFIHSLCSHVYALNTGKIIAEGTPAEVLRHPVVIEAYLGG